MKIKDIYKKYGIPPNLQEHMFRVAGVVEFVLNNWNGAKLEKEKLLIAALTHDLGNLVRYDFDNPKFVYVNGTEIKYWKDTKNKMIKKYGYVDDEVTEKILNEIGADKKIINTIKAKAFLNSKKILYSNDWELKILLYSDLRVLPNSIGSLKLRLQEVRERRNDLTSNPEFENLCIACEKIETEIQDNLKVSVDLINDKNIKINKNKYLQMEI